MRIHRVRTVPILSVYLFTIHKVVLMGCWHYIRRQDVAALASVAPDCSQGACLVLVEAHSQRGCMGSWHVPNVVRMVVHVENFLLLSS